MALSLLPLLLALPQGAPQQTPERLPVAVHYAGDPQSERGRAFVAFLGEQFATVGTSSRKQLKTAEAAAARFADADVLVVDTDLTGRLPRGYDKPMVVVSGPGQRTAESLGARLDWL